MPTPKLEFEGNRLWVNGDEVILTYLELRLVTLLWDNRGRLLTYETIVNDVWDIAEERDVRNVKSLVKRLHRKAPGLLINRRGIGYGIFQ